MINTYALILDGFALHALITKESIIREPKVMIALPYIVAIVDTITILLWVICWIVGLCSSIGCCCEKKTYLLLAVSTVGPTLSLVIHLPYVVIAYLNDASYATSIFIYYIITTFVLFGALDLSYGTCQGAIIAAQKRNRVQAGDGDQQPQENNSHDPYNTWMCPKTKNSIVVCFVVLIPAFALIILVLMGMVTAALVTIPISKSLSDAPSRLMGFYQSAFVLIGAYLIYRNFFKKKPSIELAVKNRKEHITNPDETEDNRVQWQDMSKDEKMEKFYSRVVHIVANFTQQVDGQNINPQAIPASAEAQENINPQVIPAAAEGQGRTLDTNERTPLTGTPTEVT